MRWVKSRYVCFKPLEVVCILPKAGTRLRQGDCRYVQYGYPAKALFDQAVNQSGCTAANIEDSADFGCARGGFSAPLPGATGFAVALQSEFEVLEWIHQQPEMKSLIVIILSLSIHEGDICRAYELGANAFLVKPSSTDTLADMCQALKHFWLIHNHPPVETLVPP